MWFNQGWECPCSAHSWRRKEWKEKALSCPRGGGWVVVASARKVSKGGSTVPVSRDAAGLLEMEGVKVSLPQALA